MSQEDLTRFLQQLREDEQLRRDVAALAAERGYEVTAEELGDADLDEIAGGPNRRPHDHIGSILDPGDTLLEP